MSTHPPKSFPVDGTLGATLVGFAASCFLFGISTAQAYTYFARYPQDKQFYKVLVFIVWFLELIDQAFIGHSVYFYTITNFSRPLALITSNIKWSFILQLLVGAFTGTVVKSCFTFRVYRFSNRNLPVTLIIVMLIFAHFGVAVSYACRALEHPRFPSVDDLRILGTLSLAMGVLTDLVTAGALCFFLSRFKTGYQRADTVVNRLSIYAVNTGLLTSAISLATLILYNSMPHNLVFVGCYFVLSKLYAISFLATLNTRSIIRGRGTDNKENQSSGTIFKMVKSQPHIQVGIRQEVISAVSESGLVEKGEPEPFSPFSEPEEDRNSEYVEVW